MSLDSDLMPVISTFLTYIVSKKDVILILSFSSFNVREVE
jgi:hypothetical protein